MLRWLPQQREELRGLIHGGGGVGGGLRTRVIAKEPIS